jgi:release factor glutamine methyltransferase
MGRAPQLVARWTERLVAAGVPDAGLSVRYCLAKALGGRNLPTADAALARGARLTAAQAAEMDALCARRQRREPLQYVVGDWDFDVLENVRVRPPTLIPRPETEELVGLAAGVVRALLAPTGAGAAGSDAPAAGLAAAVRAMRQEAGRDNSSAAAATVSVLEVGCGSGVISLSLAKRFPPLLVALTAIDVAPHAVALTNENAAAQGVPASQLRVVRCDFADFGADGDDGGSSGSSGSGPGRPHHPAQQRQRFHLLVSNPPYVPDADIGGLEDEVRAWEDHRALAGGHPDGLGLILRMLATAARRNWLVDGGLALLECHSSHPALLAALLRPRDGGQLQPLTLMRSSLLGPGAPPPDEMDVAAAVDALAADDRRVFDEVAADGDDGRLLRRAWRLVGAYSDASRRPRFVAVQRVSEGQ